MDKKIINAVFRSDAGHGWLQVSISDFNFVRIAFDDAFDDSLKVSQCSYRDRSFVYLEEDRDATSFIEAAKKCEIELKTIEKNDGDHSPIRNKHRFCWDDFQSVCDLEATLRVQKKGALK